MTETQGRTTCERLLDTDQLLIADGGMGTLLMQRGLEVGGCPELLNVDEPGIVARIHEEYVDAGADIILSNTFGGSAARLAHFGLENRVDELNATGVEVARSVAVDADRPVAVAGSMGPIGELFTPYGPLDRDRALALFGEQGEALAGAGADVLWIETISSLDELSAAFDAAAKTELPIVTTMSFDAHGKTMMGVSAAQLGTWALERSRLPLAIGANCGIGPEDVVEAVRAINEVAPAIATVAKANCGLPVMVDGKVEYPLGPVEMPPYAAKAFRLGARIVGACCGATPAHVAAIREATEPGRLPLSASPE